jgi:5-hydroxyisourate hydrolase-like protein (transthyretin family)
MVAPRLGATTRKQATKQLKVLFKQAADALGKIDSAVELVKLTDPVFYTGYKSARKIVNKGSGKLAVKGLVTDAQSGEPVKGVTIIFINAGETSPAIPAANAEPVLTKTSAEKGRFYIKTLPAGVYRVSFKKMGYTEQFATVNVNDGELSTVEIALHQNQDEG